MILLNLSLTPLPLFRSGVFFDLFFFEALVNLVGVRLFKVKKMIEYLEI